MAGVVFTPRLQLKNILFATDFSAASELPLPFVKWLARHFGATVFLAHIFLPEPMYEVPLDPLPAEYAHKRQVAETRMNTFIQVHDFLDIPHQVLLAEGDTWPALAHMIEEKEIDMVVVGTHGRAGIKSLMLGSVAEEVLRGASCPVMTVGPHVRFSADTPIGEIHHILYATNFSPASEDAFVYALSMAQDDHARLTLLHVVEEPDVDTVMPYPQVEIERAQQRLRDLIPEKADLWCEPEILVETGTPAEAILETARARGADLVIMGAHHSATPHGSAHAPWRTVHRVICEAPCPVLTLRS
jgi:nucleotide-binding universal stress UspA family protein